jgi:hypothetical protein
MRSRLPRGLLRKLLQRQNRRLVRARVPVLQQALQLED